MTSGSVRESPGFNIRAHSKDRLEYGKLRPTARREGMLRRLGITVATLGLLLVSAGSVESARFADPGHTPSPQNLIAKVMRLRAGGIVAAVEPLRDAGPAGWTAPDNIARNFTVLGHHDLGGGGFNADVWLHGTTAYVGVWGRDPSEEITCPASGVKVVDIADPTAPVLLGTLPNPTLTTAEDVVVRSVSTPFFTGDLLVTGIQACGGYHEVFRGLQFWDVTDPAAPVQLGQWSVAWPMIGCHEVDLVQTTAGKVLAACTTPFAEQYDVGEPLAIVDATNPLEPVKIGTYYDPLQAGWGCTSIALAHSPRFVQNGKRMYVSYWDSGTVELNITDPTHPTLRSRIQISPTDEDGDNHSITEVGGRWVIVNPEDFSPNVCGTSFGGWGEAWLYERRGGQITFRGTFATANSQSTRTDGMYTVHNTEVWGSNQAFSSWYSDGIRWWQFSSTGQTRQKGFFVPPAVPDPQGYWPTEPLVWGVAISPDLDLVLASDMNGGLYILRPTGL
jgi:hypothetical protein